MEAAIQHIISGLLPQAPCVVWPAPRAPLERYQQLHPVPANAMQVSVAHGAVLVGPLLAAALGLRKHSALSPSSTGGMQLVLPVVDLLVLLQQLGSTVALGLVSVPWCVCVWLGQLWDLSPGVAQASSDPLDLPVAPGHKRARKGPPAA